MNTACTGAGGESGPAGPRRGGAARGDPGGAGRGGPHRSDDRSEEADAHRGAPARGGEARRSQARGVRARPGTAVFMLVPLLWMAALLPRHRPLLANPMHAADVATAHRVASDSCSAFEGAMLGQHALCDEYPGVVYEHPAPFGGCRPPRWRSTSGRRWRRPGRPASSRRSARGCCAAPPTCGTTCRRRWRGNWTP